MRLPVVLLCLGLLGASCANNFLHADFSNDTIGARPSAALFGEPEGDTLVFHPDIASRLKVETWNPGSKALDYQNTPITSTISGHQDWLSFKSRPASFGKSVVYTTWLRPNLSAESAELLIDFDDGFSTLITRLILRPLVGMDGAIILVDDFSSEFGSEVVGTYQGGTDLALILTFHPSTNKFDLSVLQQGVQVDKKAIASLTNNPQDYAARPRPRMSFKIEGSTNAYPPNQVLINQVTIGSE